MKQMFWPKTIGCPCTSCIYNVRSKDSFLYQSNNLQLMKELYLFHIKDQSTQQRTLRHKNHSPGNMKHCYYSDQHICVHNIIDRTIHEHNLHHTDQLPCYTVHCLCSVQNIVVYNQSRTIHLGILLDWNNWK